KADVVHGVFKKNTKSSISPDIVIRRRIDESISNGQNEWYRFYLQHLSTIEDKAQVAKSTQYISKLHYENMTVVRAGEEGISPEAFEEKYGSGDITLEPLSNARLYSKVDGYPEGRGNLVLMIITMGLSILI